MAKKSASRIAKTPNLVVSKPESVLGRTITLDKAGLFKALGKAIAHVNAGKLEDLWADGGEVIAALGLKPDPSSLTWLLIQRSLLRAMHDLVNESLIHLDGTPSPKVEDVATQLDRELEKAELEVSPNFFRQPGQLPFLKPSSEWFRLLLVAAGFAEPTSKAISGRLPKYFVYALNQEWREKSDRYAPILQSAETPFTKAGRKEQAWEGYLAWIERELDAPMFGEPFSLRQLYVPLRGYYHIAVQAVKGGGESERPEMRTGIEEKKRVAVMLNGHLKKWVNQNEKEDAVRVLSGGPGSGKSSFAKMLVVQVNQETSWKALYIPLHQINYRGDLVPAIVDYLQRTHLLPDHPAHPMDPKEGDDHLLLVFDGLDELAMLGKIAENQAYQFAQAVKELVRDKNTSALRLKALITGRTVVMDALEGHFRQVGAVLHLSPYFVEEHEKDEYMRGWALLGEVDQRDIWWRNYGEVTGCGYQGLPLKREDLVEVTAEPLLNYLLALTYRSGTLDFDRDVSQNEIYGSLVHEVYQRRWGSGENFHVRGMNENRFLRVLEEVAVAAWHGDGRKTTVGEIKKHCKDAGIEKMLEVFQEGAEAGVLRLLTAFFFRQSGIRDDENAFEFTHKSFGEYLVARRLVRMLDMINEKLREQEENFTGWNDRTALEYWARLCGSSMLTEKQQEFLMNEIRLSDGKVEDWLHALVDLCNALLAKGMPMEKFDGQPFNEMTRQSRNAEESLLVAVSCCTWITSETVRLRWPRPTSAGEWIRRLQGQRQGDDNGMAMAFMCRIDFSGQILHMGDFYKANFENAIFDDCGMFGAQAQHAVFGSASFTRSNLRYANFYGASLNGASFAEADLGSALFEAAQLIGADFEGAHLEECVLKRARMEGASFKGANLRNASLEKVVAKGINLEGAYLEGTGLKGAELERANLKGAKLKGANLEGANLEGANLEGANLEGANLEGANLEGANLEGANLEGANLEGTRAC